MLGAISDNGFNGTFSSEPENHRDRNDGLLIGYVGLITVPVAYNKVMQKAPEAAKVAMAFFCMEKIFKWEC